MTAERRIAKGPRVQFEKAITVRMMGIDGTWARECLLLDVSEGGAKIEVVGNIAGLSLSEFFLVLSATGHTFRRCRLRWCNGQNLGVEFIKKDAARRRPAAAESARSAGPQRAVPGPNPLRKSPYSSVVEV